MRNKIMKNKSLIMIVSILLISIFLAASMVTAGEINLSGSPTIVSQIDNDDEFQGEIDQSDEQIIVPPIEDDGFPGDIDQSDEQIIVPPIDDGDDVSPDQGGPATPITPVQLKCQFWVGEPYNMYVPGTMINGECVPDYLPVGSPVCSICPNAETEETHTLDFISDSFFNLLFI